MKILMIGWELPPFNSGGLGVACLGLSKALAKKGANITFVLPKSCDVNYDFMNILFADIGEDSELFSNSYMTLMMGVNGRKTFGSFPPDYVRSAIKYAKKIQKMVKKLNVDIVHAHDWMTYDAGIAASKVLEKPMVAHIHNTVFDRCGNNVDPFQYEIEKRGFEKAGKIVAISNYVKNTLIKGYGTKKDKIQVIHNGVENSVEKKLAPALKPLKELGYKIVLFLGRITIQKGPDYFIRAAKKVIEYDPKVIFVMVGSGDMQQQVMSLAAQLGIIENILFTGFLRGNDKKRIYQAADLFVMPSISEPFGIVPLEAVANRTPVLISKQSGVSEVLDHALKVDFWDIDEMANKILAVLSYKELGSDLRSKSLKELKKINWNVAADKCLDVYSQLT